MQVLEVRPLSARAVERTETGGGIGNCSSSYTRGGPEMLKTVVEAIHALATDNGCTTAHAHTKLHREEFPKNGSRRCRLRGMTHFGDGWASMTSRLCHHRPPLPRAIASRRNSSVVNKVHTRQQHRNWADTM